MRHETSRPALAPMDDRKWIAIMIAAMLLLLVAVAAILSAAGLGDRHPRGDESVARSDSRTDLCVAVSVQRSSRFGAKIPCLGPHV
jgi:hypothetical protein